MACRQFASTFHGIRTWLLASKLSSAADAAAATALAEHACAVHSLFHSTGPLAALSSERDRPALLLNRTEEAAAPVAEAVASCMARQWPVISFGRPDSSSTLLTAVPDSQHLRLAHATLAQAVQELLGVQDSAVLQPGYRAFGPHTIHPDQIFHRSAHSIALVNIKPILPGHVLVITKRPCARFTDLQDEEVADLWLTARRVGTALERHYGASSLTLAIQDGRDAGQSVPHVHVHVLPRAPLDLEDNDQIYGMLDDSGMQGGESFRGSGGGVALDPGVLPSASADQVLGPPRALHGSAPRNVAPGPAALGDGAGSPISGALVQGQPIGEVGAPGTPSAGIAAEIQPARSRAMQSMEAMAAEAVRYRALPELAT